MSKVSKNIKMLDILSSGRRYSCKELADKLEISPRMVSLYKDELEKDGIYIDSFYGKDGGYQLRSKLNLPLILFNESDIETIDNAISCCNDSKKVEKLLDLREKIVCYCNLINYKEDFFDEKQKGLLKIISESIQKREKIKIEYKSKGVKKQRIVYPQKIYKYDNFVMVVVQYSEDINDIRHLNLNRIEKIIN